MVLYAIMQICWVYPIEYEYFFAVHENGDAGSGTYAMPEATNAQVYIVVVAVVVFLLLFIEVRDCALCFPLICCCCGAHSQFTTQINMAKKWQWQKQSKWQVGNTGRGLLPPDSYVKII